MRKTKRQRKETMTREHPKWEEFCETLEGEGYCDFRPGIRGFTWDCDSRTHTHATRLLKEMGMDVRSSLKYFHEHGGHCDCEILFNVQED